MESSLSIFSFPEDTVPTVKHTFRKVRLVNNTPNCRIEVSGPRLRLFHKAELDSGFNLTDIIAVDISGRRQFEVKIAFLPREAPSRKYLPQLVYESGVAVVSIGFSSYGEYNPFLYTLFAAGIFMPMHLDADLIKELHEKGSFHLLKRLPPVRKYVKDDNILTAMFPDWTVRKYEN